MRRFVLDRKRDVSGVSGTGVVAEGVEYSTGAVSLHWLGPDGSTNAYPNIGAIQRIHGHKGSTCIKWLDPPQ